MLWTIISKELKSILVSPKFSVTFAACSVLMLLSVYVGIQEYQSNVAAYQAGQELDRQFLAEQTWANLSTRAYRPPMPMQIFVSGVHNDVGRFSSIVPGEEVKLRRSNYSDDPIFAVFRLIDFAFIVQVVFSLFAILFTFDLINGERESGTLQLTFSNSIPRSTFIFGKFAGAWLGLTVPLAIPMLLSVLMLLLFRIPMTGQDWSALGLLMLVSVLFFTFFIGFGTLTSTLTRRSSGAFLLSLVSWVILVLIVPRAGSMLAGQLVDVPSVSEIESRQDKFASDRWTQYREALQSRWASRRQEASSLSQEERTSFNRDHMGEWMRNDAADRREVTKDIAEHSRRLNEERRNLRSQQERLAFSLSRFSPASSFLLAAMNLAETDIELKKRSEDSMHLFREDILELAKEKGDGEGPGRRLGMTITQRGNAKPGFKMSFAGGNDRPTLDPSQVPAYQGSRLTTAETTAPALIDAGLLSLYSLAAFAGAFVFFLRGDVR